MKTTPNLMIQGTTSSAGKSFLTAALCRIFRNQGISVCPFKSQNMALNSFITKDGLEMGRAQVVQAECAGIEPDVTMNPILLKPNSDMGSQVILMGKVYKNLDAKAYYKKKSDFIPIIDKAYTALTEKHDLIIIEGAGSPAEINLSENDIVNMGLAELVDSPVILIADIDRGGVFASLYGTVKLLEEKYQNRIKGFIINKFRGDRKLLEPGLKMIEEKINIPCLGVIPYKKFKIDDEDSVSERFNLKKSSKSFKIGIVKFPHISNFSDFTVFDFYDDIEVKYLTEKKDFFQDYNLLILPGSKNTIADLNTLRENGLIKPLTKLINKTFTVGICGGYQMLGKSIKDPYGVEGKITSSRGLGILNTETSILKEKTTRQVNGVTEDGLKVSGFFLHMGETEGEGKPFCTLTDGNLEGIQTPSVIGTYIHGIFDSDDFRESLLLKLGYQGDSPSYKINKDREYDCLARFVSEHVDLEKIQEIITQN